ncbi:uncharacterized protein PgNI_09526 [Pyricularia grisea]|uniref:Uncharacterized protein n=1 Tax=Pyricularia grisea TaxID=148305 RepID=A0A6P8ATE6_PYRGI|nr:uncharacterized protein PgNI_09526 [Pyricularia grisea]TLD05404.1 hypothetical protein PgNI_09526 [Pyricularia grisea]
MQIWMGRVVRLVIDGVQQYKKDREGDRRSVAYKWATNWVLWATRRLTTEPGVLPRWGRYSKVKEPNKAQTSGNVLKNYCRQVGIIK